jgi:hypothetical protein
VNFSMDVFLPRQPDGTFAVPSSANDVHQSETLKAKSPQELNEEISCLSKRRVKMISVRRQQVLRLGQSRLQQALADHDIVVGSIGYAGGFTGSLGRGYESAVSDTLRALEQAAELKANSLVILPGSRARLTYNHASKTVLAGLERCLDDALRFRINMQVALNTVLGGGKDVFSPIKQSPLEWIADMDSHRIRGRMVVRGPESWDALPDCWRSCLLSGGILRLSRRCRELEGTRNVIARVVRELNQPIPVIKSGTVGVKQR